MPEFPAILNLSDDTKLGLVRKMVTAHSRPPGVICPVCDQLLQVYQRVLYSTMAYAMVLLHQHFQANPRHQWVHAERLFASHPRGFSSLRGDIAKLRFWDLVELDDRGGRTGYYRLTPLGTRFVRNKHRTWKWLLVRNNEVIAKSTEMTTIVDALEPRWNYATLMEG